MRHIFRPLDGLLRERRLLRDQPDGAKEQDLKKMENLHMAEFREKSKNAYDKVNDRVQEYRTETQKLRNQLSAVRNSNSQWQNLQQRRLRNVEEKTGRITREIGKTYKTYSDDVLKQMSAGNKNIAKLSQLQDRLFYRVDVLENFYTHVETIIGNVEKDLLAKNVNVQPTLKERMLARRMETFDRQRNSTNEQDQLRTIEIDWYSQPFNKMENRAYHLLRLPGNADVSFEGSPLPQKGRDYDEINLSGGAKYVKFTSEFMQRIPAEEPLPFRMRLAFPDPNGGPDQVHIATPHKTTDGLNNLTFSFEQRAQAERKPRRPIFEQRPQQPPAEQKPPAEKKELPPQEKKELPPQDKKELPPQDKPNEPIRLRRKETAEPAPVPQLEEHGEPMSLDRMRDYLSTKYLPSLDAYFKNVPQDKQSVAGAMKQAGFTDADPQNTNPDTKQYTFSMEKDARRIVVTYKEGKLQLQSVDYTKEYKVSTNVNFLGNTFHRLNAFGATPVVIKQVQEALERVLKDTPEAMDEILAKSGCNVSSMTQGLTRAELPLKDGKTFVIEIQNGKILSCGLATEKKEAPKDIVAQMKEIFDALRQGSDKINGAVVRAALDTLAAAFPDPQALLKVLTELGVTAKLEGQKIVASLNIGNNVLVFSIENGKVTEAGVQVPNDEPKSSNAGIALIVPLIAVAAVPLVGITYKKARELGAKETKVEVPKPTTKIAPSAPEVPAAKLELPNKLDQATVDRILKEKNPGKILGITGEASEAEIYRVSEHYKMLCREAQAKGAIKEVIQMNVLIERLDEAAIRLNAQIVLKSKDPLRVLGVSANATVQELEDAFFRRQAMYRYLDNFGYPEAEQIRQKVEEAYKVVRKGRPLPEVNIPSSPAAEAQKPGAEAQEKPKPAESAKTPEAANKPKGIPALKEEVRGRIRGTGDPYKILGINPADIPHESEIRMIQNKLLAQVLKDPADIPKAKQLIADLYLIEVAVNKDRSKLLSDPEWKALKQQIKALLRDPKDIDIAEKIVKARHMVTNRNPAVHFDFEEGFVRVSPEEYFKPAEKASEAPGKKPSGPRAAPESKWPNKEALFKNYLRNPENAADLNRVRDCFQHIENAFADAKRLGPDNLKAIVAQNLEEIRGVLKDPNALTAICEDYGNFIKGAPWKNADKTIWPLGEGAPALPVQKKPAQIGLDEKPKAPTAKHAPPDAKVGDVVPEGRMAKFESKIKTFLREPDNPEHLKQAKDLLNRLRLKETSEDLVKLRELMGDPSKCDVLVRSYKREFSIRNRKLPPETGAPEKRVEKTPVEKKKRPERKQPKISDEKLERKPRVPEADKPPVTKEAPTASTSSGEPEKSKPKAPSKNMERWLKRKDYLDTVNRPLQDALTAAQKRVKELKLKPGVNGAVDLEEAIKAENIMRARYGEAVVGKHGAFVTEAGELTADGKKIIAIHELGEGFSPEVLKAKRAALLKEFGPGSALGADAAKIEENVDYLLRAGVCGDVEEAAATAERMRGLRPGFNPVEGGGTVGKISHEERAMQRLMQKMKVENTEDVLKFLKQMKAANAIELDVATLVAIEHSQGAQKLVLGAMKSANPEAEMVRVMNAARAAQAWRILGNVATVGGDLFGLWMAAEDMKSYGLKIEEAKRTGNKELQALYEQGRICPILQGGSSVVGIAFTGYAFVNAAVAGHGLVGALAASSSMVMLPLALATMAGVETYKAWEEIQEYQAIKARDLKGKSPGAMLQHIDKSSDKWGGGSINWFQTMQSYLPGFNSMDANDKARAEGYCAYYMEIAPKYVSFPTEADVLARDKRAGKEVKRTPDEMKKATMELYEQRLKVFVCHAINYLTLQTKGLELSKQPQDQVKKLKEAENYASAMYRAMPPEKIDSDKTPDLANFYKELDLSDDIVGDERKKQSNAYRAKADQIASMKDHPELFGALLEGFVLENIRHELAACELKILQTDYPNWSNSTAQVTMNAEQRMQWMARGAMASWVRANLGAMMERCYDTSQTISGGEITTMITTIKRHLLVEDVGQVGARHLEHGATRDEHWGKDERLLTVDGMSKYLRGVPISTPGQGVPEGKSTEGTSMQYLDNGTGNKRLYLNKSMILTGLEGYRYVDANNPGHLMYSNNGKLVVNGPVKILFWRPGSTVDASKPDLVVDVVNDAPATARELNLENNSKETPLARNLLQDGDMKVATKDGKLWVAGMYGCHVRNDRINVDTGQYQHVWFNDNVAGFMGAGKFRIWKPGRNPDVDPPDTVLETVSREAESDRAGRTSTTMLRKSERSGNYHMQYTMPDGRTEVVTDRPVDLTKEGEKDVVAIFGIPDTKNKDKAYQYEIRSAAFMDNAGYAPEARQIIRDLLTTPHEKGSQFSLERVLKLFDSTKSKSEELAKKLLPLYENPYADKKEILENLFDDLRAGKSMDVVMASIEHNVLGGTDIAHPYEIDPKNPPKNIKWIGKPLFLQLPDTDWQWGQVGPDGKSMVNKLGVNTSEMHAGKLQWSGQPGQLRFWRGNTDPEKASEKFDIKVS